MCSSLSITYLTFIYGPQTHLYILAIVTQAAMNMGEQLSLLDPRFNSFE